MRLNFKMLALSKRERLLVWGIIAVAPALLVTGLITSPAHDRIVALRQEAIKDRNETQKLQAQLEKLQATPAALRTEGDPAQLKQQINEMNSRIAELKRDLVPADRMPALLQDLLSRESGLELVSLRTMPVAAVLDASDPLATGSAAGSAPTKQRQQNIYKHGVVLTVRGSYGALHQYLQRLETSQWRLFWWGAQLASEDKSRLLLTLTVYTLSFDKAWIHV
jgi:MSHA biogenesis protein MshJ